jgi:hypothetical protein
MYNEGPSNPVRRKGMRRALGVVTVLFAFALAAQAQDTKKILETFRRNFAIASLDVKIQILQDASSGKNAPDMGPLFHQAVDFVVDNASLIPSDPRFLQLAAIAADQTGAVGYLPARFSVWKLFSIAADAETLAKAAGALGVIGAGDREIIADLNRWIDTQNTLFASGKTTDALVIAAGLQALGKLGDPSSFPFVFSAMNLGYSDQVASVAKEALLSIKGDFRDMILDVIKGRPLGEKKLALQTGIESDKLSDDQKAEVAAYSLDVSLHSVATDTTGKSILRDIRFIAARALGERKWSKATPLAIEHLDMSIGEFDKGLVDINRLLDAIGSLGAMNTHDAAARLTQYLVLVNSYTEKNKGFDERIVMAIVTNLGALGDKVAFDDLMYTQYLSYSPSVKKAARSALDKLKW